jgi:PUA-domain protein
VNVLPSTQRKRLKQKETRNFLEQFTKEYGSFGKFTEEQTGVEMSEINEKVVFFLDNEPSIVKIGARLYPTLVFKKVLERLPRVIVDMGAIPHICNGADIMAPGVRNVQGDFLAGSVVAVAEDKYGKYLAIGETTMDSDEMRRTRQGKVMKNRHYVGDEIWNFLSTTKR